MDVQKKLALASGLLVELEETMRTQRSAKARSERNVEQSRDNERQRDASASWTYQSMTG